MTEIWVPPSFTRDENRQVLFCHVCEATFELDQADAFGRHVDACSQTNDREIDEQLNDNSPARRMPGLFGPEAGDPELEQWFKDHRDEILEGRLKP